MNSPFNYTPSDRMLRAYHDMLRRGIMTTPPFRDEIKKGKMMGILLVRDSHGDESFLAAFSGQVADSFIWPGFVPPVFDYLDPEGYFKTRERDITQLNRMITDLENTSYPAILQKYETEKEDVDRMVDEARQRMTEAKSRRDDRRKEGVSAKEEELLIRESQFLKAELHRTKLAARQRLAPIMEQLDRCKADISALKEKRRQMSESLQRWLFSNFRMLNARGESKDLNMIFREFNGTMPPSGSGECCAPKLLQYAYLHNLQPLEIAEFWHGRSPKGEIRWHGAHYPACRSKCHPILSWMLQGLTIDDTEESVSKQELRPEIIYENSYFCVVNKPSGLLSVSGKGCSPSVVSLLHEHYSRDIFPVHRLDRDTSGLMILAFDTCSQSRLQRMFERIMVRKRYVAVLDGDFSSTGLPAEGKISIPLAPDLNDRPRQMVDLRYANGGKDAVTDYKVLKIKNGLTYIEFRPITGRTHQLRLHAASPHGLGIPIVGDSLYYLPDRTLSPRMLLHAMRIDFSFLGIPYSFAVPPDFPFSCLRRR